MALQAGRVASLPTIECGKCGQPSPPRERYCPSCSEDVDYPNINHAAWEVEREALQERYDSACADAKGRHCFGQLRAFQAAIDRSQAVIPLWLGQLHNFLTADRTVYFPHHRRVRSGSLIPKNDEWDPFRVIVEGTIHPFYWDRLHYSALSTNGSGVEAYGDCYVTLRQELVRDCASIFEKNPFVFAKEKQIIERLWNRRWRLNAATRIMWDECLDAAARLDIEVDVVA